MVRYETLPEEDDPVYEPMIQSEEEREVTHWALWLLQKQLSTGEQVRV